MAAIAELAVVVVFDNPSLRCFGRRQQREPSAEAHRAAKRLLMRRRNEGETKVRRLPQALFDDKPFGIDWDWFELGARCGKTISCADRTGVLEPHAVGRIEQHAADELKTVLGAVDDENLIGFAGDAAIGAKNMLSMAARLSEQTGSMRAVRWRLIAADAGTGLIRTGSRTTVNAYLRMTTD